MRRRGWLCLVLLAASCGCSWYNQPAGARRSDPHKSSPVFDDMRRDLDAEMAEFSGQASSAKR